MESHHRHDRHQHDNHRNSSHEHGGPHRHDAVGEDEAAAMIELLDLDAEVMHAYLSDVVAWVHELTGDRPVRRILDVGSGTGNGALALLRRFDLAEVVAVDMSTPMLDRLMGKARDLGLANRIRTVQADLDEAWPAVDPVDLAWASNSLHHMADPVRTLGEVFARIRPDGLLVAAELDSFPRFLPDDLGLGRPGLEARCHAVMDEQRADELPHLGSDWASLLSAAGFTIQAERTFTIDLTHPLPAATGRYAQASLRRMRSGLHQSGPDQSGPDQSGPDQSGPDQSGPDQSGPDQSGAYQSGADRSDLDGRMSVDDLATLDSLIDSDGNHSVLRRDDLAVHAARTVWVARRP
jgi:SAM-dependent methyltransferase